MKRGFKLERSVYCIVRSPREFLYGVGTLHISLPGKSKAQVPSIYSTISFITSSFIMMELFALCLFAPVFYLP
jgi:hypothetical protein